LKIVKTQGLAADGSDLTHSDIDVHVGDVSHYKLVVTNTGNVSLRTSTPDPPLGQTGCAGKLQTTLASGTDVPLPDTLAAGASATWYCQHTVAQADADAGDRDNTVCVEGKDRAGGAAAGDPDAAALCDTVTTHVLDPKVKIEKTQSLKTDGTGFVSSDIDV